MIKFENSEIMGWRAAIRGITAKGYRKTTNGKYEAFVSNHSKSIYLGTYDSPEEAAKAVFEYRINRFVSGVEKYNLNPDDGVVYEDNYIAFPNGMIFNLHGERMIGGVNKSGYRQGIFNGKNIDHHKIIADCFLPNPDNLRDVNHKNGNKLNIDISNLERTSHADNIKHAFRTGLMKKRLGENHHSHKLTRNDVDYIRSVYSKRDPHYGAVALAKKFGVDRTTIFDVVNRKTWRYE